jgi:hypothetical protein
MRALNLLFIFQDGEKFFQNTLRVYHPSHARRESALAASNSAFYSSGLLFPRAIPHFILLICFCRERFSILFP